MSTHPDIKQHLAVDEDLLKACIHCGMCLPSCPTYGVTGSEAESPRGRLYLMRQLQDSPDTPTAEAVGLHLDRCLGCLACQTVCPSGVQYGELLVQARETLNKKRASTRVSRWLRRLVYRFILPSRPAMELAGTLLHWYQQSGLDALLANTGLLRPFGRLEIWRNFLPPIDTSPPLVTGRVFPAAVARGQKEAPPRVGLLIGCMMPIFYNRVHLATIRALTASGAEVLIHANQTCCGALAHHAGEVDIAARLARQNINAFESAKLDALIVNSAGCGATIKEYPHVVAGNNEPAADVSIHSFDVMEWLAARLREGKMPPLRSDPLKVAYHAACHLYHAQGVHEPPIEVLAAIEGIELVPLTDATTCCGSAGTYNLEQPDISLELLRRKREQVLASGADVVVAGNPGCMLQLEAGLHDTPVLVRHPVELVAEALSAL